MKQFKLNETIKNDIINVLNTASFPQLTYKDHKNIMIHVENKLNNLEEIEKFTCKCKGK